MGVSLPENVKLLIRDPYAGFTSSCRIAHRNDLSGQSFWECLHHESKDGQDQTCSKQAGAAVSGRIHVVGCGSHAVVSILLLAECSSRGRCLSVWWHGCNYRTVSAPFWILENSGQKFGANIADGRDAVCFFFYNVEELYHRGRNGGIGSIVAAFPDTKIVFIDFIHWNWSGTFVVECPLPAGPSQSN